MKHLLTTLLALTITALSFSQNYDNCIIVHNDGVLQKLVTEGEFVVNLTEDSLTISTGGHVFFRGAVVEEIGQGVIEVAIDEKVSVDVARQGKKFLVVYQRSKDYILYF